MSRLVRGAIRNPWSTFGLVSDLTSAKQHSSAPWASASIPVCAKQTATPNVAGASATMPLRELHTSSAGTTTQSRRTVGYACAHPQ
jgi:hypothetical protein